MTEAAQEKRFYGKYRGTVVLNVDPELRGRITCLVPDVLGPMPSSWCEACPPLAGPTGPPMGVYFVPPPGAGVWVEFEQGDPNRPIWTGCRFASSNVPPLALAGNPADPNLCLQSLLQHTLLISDMPPTPLTGGIVLKSTTGAMIVVNDAGIFINNGKGASITLVGPAITLNNGALTVI
jgi:hypothetical protein